jgi:predicted RNA polymerase sigma factor
MEPGRSISWCAFLCNCFSSAESIGLPFMTDNNAEQVRERVDAVYKAESRRIFAVPSPAELPARLDTVLQVIYLVFQ